MRYTSVLFDLDGTLLDTLGDLTAAMNRTLTRHGLPERTAADGAVRPDRNGQRAV